MQETHSLALASSPASSPVSVFLEFVALLSLHEALQFQPQEFLRKDKTQGEPFLQQKHTKQGMNLWQTQKECRKLVQKEKKVL